jgi:hypothetical protein
MSINTAQGYPQREGTSIPEIWSKLMQAFLYDETVSTAITNTDYEGEISGVGSKVHIRHDPRITIGDYVKGQQIDIQHPETEKQELIIDRAKYYAYAFDEIDMHQMDVPIMERTSDAASKEMALEIDSDVLHNVATQAHVHNRGTSAGAKYGGINLGTIANPVALTKENVTDFMVNVCGVLDQANVPESGRYIVIPTTMASLIKKSKLWDASAAGDSTSILRNGRLGVIDGFTIYKSHRLLYDSGNGAVHILAGHKMATTFASQIVSSDMHPYTQGFGMVNKGLNVYGFKVVKPEALAVAVVTANSTL